MGLYFWTTSLGCHCVYTHCVYTHSVMGIQLGIAGGQVRRSDNCVPLTLLVPYTYMYIVRQGYLPQYVSHTVYL